MFRTSETTADPAQSPKDITLLLSSIDPDDLVLDLEQVEPAVQLLSTTIADNVTDHQSKQFAEQLLHITIDYLHVVVRNVTLIRQQVGT